MQNHFERPIPYRFSGYTDLALRVRGDGRNYMVVIQMEHHFSVHWYDMYNYPLYTKGGPYWQFVKVNIAFQVLYNLYIQSKLLVVHRKQHTLVLREKGGCPCK